jgi:hypothetical protein
MEVTTTTVVRIGVHRMMKIRARNPNPKTMTHTHTHFKAVLFDVRLRSLSDFGTQTPFFNRLGVSLCKVLYWLSASTRSSMASLIIMSIA